MNKLVVTLCENVYEGVLDDHDDLMVISATISNARVRRVFVDPGSSTNVMLYE